MTEKIDKNSIVWAFALVMLVLNIVLGLRAVIDSRLSEEVAKQKLEIVELRSDVKSLSEKVCVLSEKVEKLYRPGTFAIGPIFEEVLHESKLHSIHR